MASLRHIIGGLALIAAVVLISGCDSSPDKKTSPGTSDSQLPDFEQQASSWPQTGVFAPASLCGECHTASMLGVSPAAMRTPHPQTNTTPSPEGEDISPLNGWRHSAMAHAFTDPYFRAKMKHETELLPHQAGFIEDKCLACHTPMARTHAHQTGVSLSLDACPDTLLPDGCYRADTAMSEPHAREGISCTLCHQMADTPAISGNYDISDSAMQIFGPFENPVSTPMINRSSYTPVFSEHIRESGHCATCHELYTPTLDISTGMPTGGLFPEQLAYSEWQNSVYTDGAAEEAHCQDCHMGRMADEFVTRIAVRPTGTVNESWPERTPFSAHDMVGGNAWLLDMMEQFRDELGLLNVTAEGGFARKAALTRQFLAAAASLSASNTSLAGGTLSFDVTLTNHSGHKFPTAYPSRRAWLAVEVTDTTDNLVFASGVPDAGHRLTVDDVYASSTCTQPQKPAGFDSSACFMPHLDVVNNAQQIPIYQTVMAATDGQITHSLLYANDILKDNRIPPRGYDMATAPADTLPRAIGADADFNAAQSGSDTVHYQLDLGASNPASVSVRLYYQAVSPDFVSSLSGEHAWINQFRTMAELVPPPAELIDEVTFELP